MRNRSKTFSLLAGIAILLSTSACTGGRGLFKKGCNCPHFGALPSTSQTSDVALAVK